MIEKLPAALTLAVCIVMLVRLMLGGSKRSQFDRGAARAWARLRGQARYLWHWRTTRRRAAAEAEEAIRRARMRLEREGNVYRPDAFQEPRKPH